MLSQLISGLTIGTSYLLTFDYALAQQVGFYGANYDNFWEVGFGNATALRPCVWLILLTALFVPLERWFGVRHDGPNGALRHNLAVYFLSSLVPIVLLSAPMALLAAWLVPDALTTTVAGLPLAACRLPCAWCWPS